MADDNARAVPVFISGATGRNAANINGFFEPTEEKGLDGRVLYRKRGDALMWMEHFQGQWQIKSVSVKGEDWCVASIEGGCAPEACTSRDWMITFDDETLVDAPGLEMVTGAEAQLKVGCCCLHARDVSPSSPCRLQLLCLTLFCAGRCACRRRGESRGRRQRASCASVYQRCHGSKRCKYQRFF